MRKQFILLASMALAANVTFADISNGDLESWSGNTPIDWSTIDSGIDVSASSTQVKSGNTSAAIVVNTRSQAATDFMQNVDVTSGETLDVSVWIRHTDGGVKARLYVDGYRDYSDATLTNEWQQVNYRYTASSSKTIPVGLRFYDVNGFDGSELVYVDLFEPTATSSTDSDSEIDTGSCDLTSGVVQLTTDDYGSETSWSLSSVQAGVVQSGSGYVSNSSESIALCLADGDYTFTINDSYGDGICCSYGSGQYSVLVGGQTVASGASFGSSESTLFLVGTGGDDGGSTGGSEDLIGYYSDANGLTGFTLKTALYNIIKNHSAQSYTALWSFYSANERDQYYENDSSILDIYSERPLASDPYTFTAVGDQCGTYSVEGDCYNREHSFPRSWFGGAVSPMNTDVHHIFPTDGKVNSYRSSYPFGEVGSASYTSQNGSMLGNAQSGLGYSGVVFEPIDEFKGDVARAYFYMATRYQNVIANWEQNSSYGDAVLDGSSDQVFETWFLAMLKDWHQLDTVSQKELDRNEAAYQYQGNRNPYVDYPDLVFDVWGD